MVLAATVVFAVSLCLIVLLFSFKYAEVRTGRYVAPRARGALDARALSLKSRLVLMRENIDRLPPIAALYARYLIHEAALGFAALARALERQAHRIADWVSHKHRFERRVSHSVYLKKVARHKEDNSL